MSLRRVPSSWCTTAAAVLAALAAYVAGTSAQQRPAPIHVAIEGTDENADTMNLKLTNVSGRPIVAWHVSVYSGGTLRDTFRGELFQFGDRMIEPRVGALVECALVSTPTFVVSAVFDDRSGAGDEGGVESIFTRRREIRDALAAWVTEFKSDLNRGPAGIDVLRARMQSVADARSGAIGTPGFNYDAAAVFSSNTPASKIRGELSKVLGRAEKQLSLAKAASVRR